MASRIALLCLLGLLVASPAIADSGIYYQLELMWPGAYCEQSSAGCCKPTTSAKPARDFFISGFTVYNATTDAPVNRCSNKAPFDPNEITDIPGLKQYWSNIKCPSNNGQGGWKNAWKMSGACSGLKEKDFFEKALEFRSRLNPLVRLQKNGIQPDFELYSLKKIKKVFQSGINATPLVQCSMGPFNKYMLYKLYFCATEQGTFIDCPVAPKYTCSAEILFHPFKRWMLQQLQGEDAEFAAAADGDDQDAFVLPGVAMDI
ncbi:hypothetical protein SEVIR_2G300600v4 [Setaria viridis]|uniref:Uncharacterized protein n=1 Tax=Setaria viridis TaxID=4556 RepID=A0A4U6VZG9_SETVI|nr:ribonuclease 1-like [Setaria viridis]TKW34343.1 hypothetical protein SEVIR_2G300600v2 [Setaria viridis]